MSARGSPASDITTVKCKTSAATHSMVAWGEGEGSLGNLLGGGRGQQVERTDLVGDRGEALALPGRLLAHGLLLALGQKVEHLKCPCRDLKTCTTFHFNFTGQVSILIFF